VIRIRLILAVFCALACAPAGVRAQETHEPVSPIAMKNEYLFLGLVKRLASINHKPAKLEWQSRVVRLLPLPRDVQVSELGNALRDLPQLTDIEQIGILVEIDLDVEATRILLRSRFDNVEPEGFLKVETPFVTRTSPEDYRLVLPEQILAARRSLDIVGPWVVARDNSAIDYAYAPRCTRRDGDTCKRVGFVQIKRGMFLEPDEAYKIGEEFDFSMLPQLQQDVVKRLPHIFKYRFYWMPMTTTAHGYGAGYAKMTAMALLDATTLPFRASHHWVSKKLLKRKRKSAELIPTVSPEAVVVLDYYVALEYFSAVVELSRKASER
jgi:hypothetical protein